MEERFYANATLAQTTEPADLNSLKGDLSIQLERLFGVASRLEGIRDAVFGAAPVGIESGTPARPPSSLAEQIADLRALVTRLENSISRL